MGGSSGKIWTDPERSLDSGTIARTAKLLLKNTPPPLSLDPWTSKPTRHTRSQRPKALVRPRKVSYTKTPHRLSIVKDYKKP